MSLKILSLTLCSSLKMFSILNYLICFNIMKTELFKFCWRKISTCLEQFFITWIPSAASIRSLYRLLFIKRKDFCNIKLYDYSNLYLFIKHFLLNHNPEIFFLLFDFILNLQLNRLDFFDAVLFENSINVQFTCIHFYSFRNLGKSINRFK